MPRAKSTKCISPIRTCFQLKAQRRSLICFVLFGQCIDWSSWSFVPYTTTWRIHFLFILTIIWAEYYLRLNFGCGTSCGERTSLLKFYLQICPNWGYRRAKCIAQGHLYSPFLHLVSPWPLPSVLRHFLICSDACTYSKPGGTPNQNGVLWIASFLIDLLKHPISAPNFEANTHKLLGGKVNDNSLRHDID